LAGYRQNAGNVINRDPDSQRQGTRSIANYRPEMRQPDMGAPAGWNPFGMRVASYDGNGRAPAAGRWDGLRGALMDVPQADLLNQAPNPWPANGVADDPMTYQAIMRVMRLKPTTSAHPGASLTSGEASPSMIFHAPPIFGLQTKPIMAVGL
jgi:hypothetical protein